MLVLPALCMTLADIEELQKKKKTKPKRMIWLFTAKQERWTICAYFQMLSGDG